MFFWGESKHPSLPLARAERKPFDRKKKLNPRYQRENHFWFSFGTQKRILALMKKCFTRAQAREAVHKETKPYRKSNLTRATSAKTISSPLLAHKREHQHPKNHTSLQKKQEAFQFLLEK